MAAELLGREPELGRVQGFLAALTSGPTTLVLEGDAGIGKTTVWRAAIGVAEGAGVRVLACRPVEAEEGLAFAALADLVGPVVDELLPALPDPQRRALEIALLRVEPGDSPLDPRAVGVAVQSILSLLLQASPVVAAVDDVPWIDRPSCDALTFAMRRTGRAPVGLLLARRPGIADGCTGLEDATPDVERVRLGPLSLSVIHELVKQRLGRSLPRPLLVRVHETSAGNPFYALEIARAVLETGVGPGDPLPVPSDLSQLVSQRVEELSPRTQEGLLVVAAAAQPSLALVSAALELNGQAVLEEAERAGIVDLRDGGVRFAHPLYAAAVYSSSSAHRKRSVHGRLAEVVSDLGERARHLAAAAEAPAEEVAGPIEEAARRARARGAASSAASLFAEASRLTPPAERATAARRLLGAAETLFDAADTAAARSILERLVEEMPAGPERARALFLMALVHNYEDGPGPAKEVCLQALREAEGEPRLEAELHLLYSFVSTDDIAAAKRSAHRAAELVAGDPEAPPDLVAAALLEDAYLRLLGGDGMATEQVERAAGLMPPHGHTWPAQRAHAALQVWSKYTDDLVRAKALAEKTAARRREEGDEYEVALTQGHLAEVECWLGEWSQAREHAAASAETIEQAGNPLARAATLYRCALVAAHLGSEREAREAALAGLQLAEEAADPWIATLNLSVLGFLELSVGDSAAADTWLTRAARAVLAMKLAEPARFRFHGDQIEAAVALGHLDRAEQLLDELRSRAEIAPRPWILATGARCEALLHAARGDVERALELVETALREHERLPMPFELARTLLVQGQIERRAKHKAAAKAALESALGRFEELGAPLWSAKARAELARVGLRRAPDDLTESERRVAELAAAGLKNREVAAQLFMSPKTVEANLARAYRKLGIRSRAELGAQLTRARGDPAQT